MFGWGKVLFGLGGKFNPTKDEDDHVGRRPWTINYRLPKGSQKTVHSIQVPSGYHWNRIRIG